LNIISKGYFFNDENEKCGDLYDENEGKYFLLEEIDDLLMKSKIMRIRNMILNNTWLDLQRSFQAFLRNEAD
jgi:hypothetical protein